MSRIWILGAADAEMVAIERVLRDAGETVAYAVGLDGQRVDQINAYRSATYHWVPGCGPSRDGSEDTNVYLVECDMHEPAWRRGVRVIRVDHHSPGDPGYGRPPAEFLSASSIGQVVAVLLRLGITDPVLTRDTHGVEYAPDGPDGVWAIIRSDIAFAAAADHCLEAAYRGQCPGVDTVALLFSRPFNHQPS